MNLAVLVRQSSHPDVHYSSLLYAGAILAAVSMYCVLECVDKAHRTRNARSEAPA